MAIRRPSFDWATTDAVRWHPRLPEFAAGANAIGLLMPYAEPFVIRQVRSASLDDLELRAQTVAWCAQEAAHHNVHRQLNTQLCAASQTAARLDGLGKRLFRVMNRLSPQTGLAFAAAFELIAFSSARWLDQRLRELLSGADENAATLFAWHLAEEVEHKGIVHDAMVASQEHAHRVRGTLLAFVVLIGWTVFGGLALFCTKRAALNPLRWARLVGWGFSYAFELLPMLAASLTRNFHPNQLVDPVAMTRWLADYDPATRTISPWNQAGLNRLSTIPHPGYIALDAESA